LYLSKYILKNTSVLRVKWLYNFSTK